jgi:hypothetical protein
MKQKFKEVQRRGEPLGKIVCAYCGTSTAWRLLLEMRNLDFLNGRKIKYKLLKERETPPPGSVLLKEVEAKGVDKFTPRPIKQNGVTVIEIPAINAVKKRVHAYAGVLGAMIGRGDRWRDRRGDEHYSPL